MPVAVNNFHQMSRQYNAHSVLPFVAMAAAAAAAGAELSETRS